MVEMLSPFSWQLHSQKMQAISICTPKKKSRFTADLSLGGEGFYTGTFNRLEIQSVELLVIFHCIPWLFIISNAKTIYLHWLFAWSKQDTISQSPVISPSFPRVNPGSTHGAALGGWTRAGSAASVSASRGERFGVAQDTQMIGWLKEDVVDASWYPNFSYYPVSNFTTLRDSFQNWFFRFCIAILSNSYIIHVFLNWTSEPSSDDWQNSCKRYTAGTWKWGYFVAFKKASPLPEEGIHFQVNPPFGFPWGS